MNDERAQTYVAPGTARLGNRWMTRRWTTFMGNTIELSPGDADFDWFTAKSDEISFVTNGTARGLLDLGGAEWSEECDQYAAVLVGRYSGSGLDVTVRNGAFHENPAFFRTVTLRNSTDETVTVSRAVLEILPIQRDRTIVMTENFSIQSEAVHWKTTEHAAAILYARHSLLVGIDGGGQFEIFDPDPTVCALVNRDPITLEPHTNHNFPETFLIPFTGDVQATVGGAYAQYQKTRDDRIASLAKMKATAAGHDGVGH